MAGTKGNLIRLTFYHRQTSLIRTLRGIESLRVNLGVGVKRDGLREYARAILPQGQSKLFVIMRCQYEVGVRKACFDCISRSIY